VRQPRISTVFAGAAAAAVLVAGCSGAGAHQRRAAEASAAPSASASSTAGPSGSPRPSAAPRPGIDLHADPASILERTKHHGVPVIGYHQVRNWTSSDSKQARPYIMPVATFKAQMRYLAAHHYHPISLDRLLAHLTTGASLPAKPVVLTFDDGEEGQFSTAFPVLEKHHFTAAFFPMTVVLGKKHWMSPEQLRTMDKAGMTIGDHTWNHHRVDRYSGHDWKRQIADSTDTLEKILGHPVHYFAYPYGVWNEDAFPHLKDNGYWAAFQLTSDPVDRKAPLYTLQRQLSDPYWNTKQFAAHLEE
jgi:peptidoglycan/xylan/chitin deacetylase (PgdA/CDA1 family)